MRALTACVTVSQRSPLISPPAAGDKGQMYQILFLRNLFKRSDPLTIGDLIALYRLVMISSTP